MRSQLPFALDNAQLYSAIDDRIVTQYATTEIPYTTYSFIERCLRFLLALFTFPISIFRVHLVREGEIGLVSCSGKPEILPPGWHVMLSPTTRFIGTEKLTEPCIQQGTIQLVRVQEGQLGYMLDHEQGRHLFLMPGRHVIRSATTEFIRFLDPTKPVNDLGSARLVSIKSRDRRTCL